MGKRLENLLKNLDRSKPYPLAKAVEIVKQNATAKFDETIELHIRLGIDPKQSDQLVRGTVALPFGTGKTRKVAVITKGDKAKEAQDAGADVVGGDDLIAVIQGGTMDFDILVATPDVMKDLARLGKVLGPRGLMPNPKSGTVTFDIAKAVKELKAGRVEYKNDDFGILHVGIGKRSFEPAQIVANAKAVLQQVVKAKPSASKGTYLRSVSLCSTMGPGISVDTSEKF
jgi:large subunit ribosomal protein L1